MKSSPPHFGRSHGQHGNPAPRGFRTRGGGWSSRTSFRLMFWRLGQQKGDLSDFDANDARESARRSRLEAVLFLAREPLGLRKLAQLANLADGTEARTLLERLRAAYDERGCAFQVAQVAGGYQLLTRREFASWLRPHRGNGSEIRLSGPALETLSVVAYRQPVLRVEVEAIRGVACGEILRHLLDLELVRIVGRSDDLGRPLRYGTTKRFLQVFGLCGLDELPWAQQLRRPADVAAAEADLPAAAADELAA